MPAWFDCFRLPSKDTSFTQAIKLLYDSNCTLTAIYSILQDIHQTHFWYTQGPFGLVSSNMPSQQTAQATAPYIPSRDVIDRHDYGVTKTRKASSTGGGRAWSDDEVGLIHGCDVHDLGTQLTPATGGISHPDSTPEDALQVHCSTSKKDRTCVPPPLSSAFPRQQSTQEGRLRLIRHLQRTPHPRPRDASKPSSRDHLPFSFAPWQCSQL